MYYLVQYDRGGGNLIDIAEYPDDELPKVDEIRLSTELEHFGAGREVEVVVLQAPHLSALRRTHRRYFDSIASIVSPLDETT